ncbi:hypothetical protein DL769_010373 [Monosporascus sp. CRB-8-3]|nr:hypothetical protein DL769_010373 [Monosporascus sp. CRB-8-3]
MGLFDFLSSAEDKRREEIRTGAVAPDRSERQRCWDARDAFWRCLDKHDVVDSLSSEGKRIADRECAPEHRVFERDCASAWVTYFKKYRVAEYQKKKTIERLEKEGANKMAVRSSSDPPASAGSPVAWLRGARGFIKGGHWATTRRLLRQPAPTEDLRGQALGRLHEEAEIARHPQRYPVELNWKEKVDLD